MTILQGFVFGVDLFVEYLMRGFLETIALSENQKWVVLSSHRDPPSHGNSLLCFSPRGLYTPTLRPACGGGQGLTLTWTVEAHQPSKGGGYTVYIYMQYLCVYSI